MLASGVGTQLVDDLPAHEARAAARRLITGLFDAGDAGDAAGGAAHFTSDGVWTDPSGERSVGAEDLVAHFAQWRAWEPFSVHWVANEQVLVDGADVATGTWLWSAASNVDGGATAAWSGGDLSVRFDATEAGWRIGSLVMSDRYRTPYRVGWLDELLVQPALGSRPSAVADEVVGMAVLGLPTVALARHRLGDEAARVAVLRAESELRWLLGEYADAVELGVDRATLAGSFTADARYASDVVVDEVCGLDAVLDAHAVEAERASAWIRALMSVQIDVAPDAGSAECRWRDIWTAEVGGEARWLAHAYAATAVATPDGWRLGELRRVALLDCSYEEGWSPGTAPGTAEETDRVVKETRR